MACFAKAFEFYCGEDKTLSIQINTHDKSLDCKQPLDLTGATAIEVEIPASPDNLIFSLLTSPVVVVDQPILGKIHIDLTDTQTNQMVTGSIIVRITNSGRTVFAVAAAASRKLLIPDC